MSSERPSQQKVVGVARKYLRHEESAARALLGVEQFTTKDLDVFEVSRISYSLGFTALGHLLILPAHRMRKSFLQYAQEVEGYAPGEERLEAYALRVSNVSDKSYPNLRKSLQK